MEAILASNGNEKSWNDERIQRPNTRLKQQQAPVFVSEFSVTRRRQKPFARFIVMFLMLLLSFTLCAVSVSACFFFIWIGVGFLSDHVFVCFTFDREKNWVVQVYIVASDFSEFN